MAARYRYLNLPFILRRRLVLWHIICLTAGEFYDITALINFTLPISARMDRIIIGVTFHIIRC